MRAVGGRRCGSLRPRCLRALLAASVSTTGGCAKPLPGRNAAWSTPSLAVALSSSALLEKGAGRSGGYRTVIAYRAGQRSVFLYGFAKNERDNIGARELDDLKKLAKLYLGYSDGQIAVALDAAELREVMCDEREES
jgi:RelE toxin of RelE / RelB toxin-antitoxin system